MDPILTKANPDLQGFDLDAMADLGAYPDGSGGGIRRLAWEMGKLREVRERLDLLSAFVRKHQLLLARLSWDLDETVIHPTKKQGMDKDIGVFVPQITLYRAAYDKRREVTAHDVAALWPDAMWRRSLPYHSFEKDTSRDFTAEVEGVLLRIPDAERLPKPKKVDRFGPCGPIRIPKSKPITTDR